MRGLLISILISTLAFGANAQTDDVETYIGSEASIAKAGVLANIGPSGNLSQGAFAGVVIASPSTDEPQNYLYTWTRDSALVFKVLVEQLTSGQDPALGPLVDAFVASQGEIQQVPNPSGNVSSGGLGEPKFYVNQTAFMSPWGRPQRDGPALRATTIIAYANWLLANGNASYVNGTLWPILELDLNYVASTWNQSTFDLWEEVNSSSYYTAAVQHRALREGSTLASALNISSVVGEYNSQADSLFCFMQTFWNPSAGYMTANTGGGRSGKDSNTVLASIHTFDVTAGCDPNTFQPCSDKALSNLKVYVDSFRGIYNINSGIASNAAVATGRYPEDIYQGGNAWYLTTFAVAEQLYDALMVWYAQSSITVTPTSLLFFEQFSAGVAPGTYAANSSTYGTLTTAVKAFADGFVAQNARWTPKDGSLAEQYSRMNGTPVGALDLTWSYASAMTAFDARDGRAPVSWGAANLSLPPACMMNSTVSQQQVTTSGARRRFELRWL